MSLLNCAHLIASLRFLVTTETIRGARLETGDRPDEAARLGVNCWLGGAPRDVAVSEAAKPRVVAVGL